MGTLRILLAEHHRLVREGMRLLIEQVPDHSVVGEDDRYVFPVLDAGVNGYVLKTTSGSELVQAIRVVHSGGTALDPIIASKLVHRSPDSLRPPAKYL